MPELPEVETIARVLRRGTDQKSGANSEALIGCTISNARVLWKRTLENMTSPEFVSRITGQTINEISRRGKYLVFTLSDDSLLIHLRMSGDMRVEMKHDERGNLVPELKHDRLILEFENGARLAFNDTRKFGRAWLVQDPQEILADLGPEPLDEDLNAEQFHKMLTSRTRQIKPLLMDQRFLAGLGNIYTDEALHLAKIHPLRKSSSVSQKEASRLLKAIRAVLTEGIRRNGASIDWVYKGGDFQNYFRVYGRGGEICPECGSTIQRLVVGQRGTHICPICQPINE